MRRRPLNAPQTIESYIRGNSAPRYMLRLRDLEAEYRTQRRCLEAAYADLHETIGDDSAEFARRWRELARAWRFERLNDLVAEHNLWYPMESNLPMDPRTGDYRPIRGASYRRLELGAPLGARPLPRGPPPGAARAPGARTARRAPGAQDPETSLTSPTHTRRRRARGQGRTGKVSPRPRLSPPVRG